jgi:hypothetical protein
MVIIYRGIPIESAGKLPPDYDPDKDVTVALAKALIDAILNK